MSRPTFLINQFSDYAKDLRLQLLEPERYPYLYKCLYGLLMLLPQSSAFAALKNRLNSVSAIGLLHTGPRAYVSSTSHHTRQRSTEAHLPLAMTLSSTVGPTTAAASAYERPTGRLKTREENAIKWVELLEKFKVVQEKSRRSQRQGQGQGMELDRDGLGMLNGAGMMGEGANKEKALPEVPKGGERPTSAEGNAQRVPPAPAQGHKSKSSLGNFGRLTSGIGPRKSKR